MSDHTPTPWVVDAVSDANGYRTIRTDDGSIHGDTDVQPIATVYRNMVRLNAEFIVTACNAHDDLVETLERIAATCSSYGNKDAERMRNIARAALAKATGGNK